jgi:hypothetical protein
MFDLSRILASLSGLLEPSEGPRRARLPSTKSPLHVQDRTELTRLIAFA